MSRLTRDGTAVSRDQILRRERRQGKIHFPCSADHEQDWQPYLVYPYPCYMCDHTYIHTYIAIDTCSSSHELHLSGIVCTGVVSIHLTEAGLPKTSRKWDFPICAARRQTRLCCRQHFLCSGARGDTSFSGAVDTGIKKKSPHASVRQRGKVWTRHHGVGSVVGWSMIRRGVPTRPQEAFLPRLDIPPRLRKSLERPASKFLKVWRGLLVRQKFLSFFFPSKVLDFLFLFFHLSRSFHRPPTLNSVHYNSTVAAGLIDY